MSKKKSESSGADTERMDDLIKHLNKNGQHAYSFSQREDPAEVKNWIGTGSTLLDYAISNRRGGGVPFGRITELHGIESSGKSLLALHMVANVQRMGGWGIILDTEDRFLEKDFLLRLGINPARCVVANPGTIEGCFEYIEKTITFFCQEEKKATPIAIVWDSIAATPPMAELEGSYDPQSQMGLASKAVARGLRKVSHVVGTQNIALIIINQLRHNMKMATPFSDPWVTPLGKALPYAASVRLRLTPGANLKLGEGKDAEVIGKSCVVKVLKNSLGPPAREAKFPVIFGYGVDDQQSLYDFLYDKKLIKKVSGVSKLTIDGKSYEFPHDKWKVWLRDNKPIVFDLIEKLMIKKYEDSDPTNDLQLTPEFSGSSEI